MRVGILGSAPKLSICISTFNRAATIGATLDSIHTQLTNDCEVVILDGGSNDHTEQVVSEYTRRSSRLRYIRQDVNNGIDRDYDRVVQLAEGEYCWLMTDDDLVKPGALSAVLNALRRDLSLLIINAELRDFSMTKVLQRRWLDLESDRVYRQDEMDRLFVEANDVLSYIGCIVIKRTIWLTRERERYYGSWFIYIGVIFQQHLPGEARVIAEPLITYRMGNAHTFSPKAAEIAFLIWPSLWESLAISESARRKVYSLEPWRHFQMLLRYRAFGYYSLTEYRRWVHPRLDSTYDKVISILIAVFPGLLIGAGLAIYCSVTRRRYQGVWWPKIILQLISKRRYRLRRSQA